MVGNLVKNADIISILTTNEPKEDTSDENANQTLKKLIKILEQAYKNYEFELLSVWFHELVKKEKELRNLKKMNPQRYDNVSVNSLILKCCFLHAKIIELIIDDVNAMYNNFQEKINKNKENIAVLNKMMAIEIISKFINNLAYNIEINRTLYQKYLKTLSDSVKIFTNY